MDINDIWDDDEDMIAHGSLDPFAMCMSCGVNHRHHVNSDYCRECVDKYDD